MADIKHYPDPADHPEVDSFIRAIDEKPGDPLPRLIFADWLEQHGYDNAGHGQRFLAKYGKFPSHSGNNDGNSWSMGGSYTGSNDSIHHGYGTGRSWVEGPEDYQRAEDNGYTGLHQRALPLRFFGPVDGTLTPTTEEGRRLHLAGWRGSADNRFADLHPEKEFLRASMRFPWTDEDIKGNQ